MRSRQHKPQRGDPMLEWRRRFKGVLEALWARQAFELMPAEIRDQFLRCRQPEPQLVFDDAFPADHEGMAFRKTLTASLRGALVENESGETMPLRDYCAILMPLAASLRRNRNKPELPKSCASFIDIALGRADDWLTHGVEAGQAIHQAVNWPLMHRGRIDGRLYCASLRLERTAAGDPVYRVHVSTVPSQSRRVTLDGESRPVYRVADTNEWDATQWLTWTPSMIGSDDAEREIPVYAQSHALRNLRARIDLPGWTEWAEYWLYQSLATPNIVERQPSGDLLIEYRMSETRLGYLVVTPMTQGAQPCAVVRTFLFLTMQPSPEARNLEKQLRLNRHDVNWLGLHELSAFTRSDLRDDPTLRPMLEACGCGHLFELDDETATPTPRQVAEEMKRYLRMAA